MYCGLDEEGDASGLLSDALLRLIECRRAAALVRKRAVTLLPAAVLPAETAPV